MRRTVFVIPGVDADQPAAANKMLDVVAGARVRSGDQGRRSGPPRFEGDRGRSSPVVTCPRDPVARKCELDRGVVGSEGIRAGAAAQRAESA